MNRRQHLADAVRQARPIVDGAWQRQGRQEWAASRIYDGWSRRLVTDAIGAGSLARVRTAIREDMYGPPRLLRAMVALGAIDTQRALETRHEHGIKPHRRRDVPLRLRAF